MNIKGVQRAIGHLNEWADEYGLGQFTWERYCYWLVETYPEFVADLLAEELRSQANNGGKHE